MNPYTTCMITIIVPMINYQMCLIKLNLKSKRCPSTTNATSTPSTPSQSSAPRVLLSIPRPVHSSPLSGMWTHPSRRAPRPEGTSHPYQVQLGLQSGPIRNLVIFVIVKEKDERILKTIEHRPRVSDQILGFLLCTDQQGNWAEQREMSSVIIKAQ